MLCNYAGIKQYTFFFFKDNIDISLIMLLKCSKSFTRVVKTHLEGSMSQNVDMGFSFTECRRWHFAKVWKNHKSYTLHVMK